MRHYTAYRLLTALLPARGRRSLPPCLRPYALHSGAVALFGEGSAETVLCFGEARRGTPVTPATFFRTASVSKMVAAMLALSLSQTGALDLDGDAADALGIPLRHPAYPSVPSRIQFLFYTFLRSCYGYTISLLLPLPHLHLSAYQEGWKRKTEHETAPQFLS